LNIYCAIKLAFLHVEKPQSSTKSLRTYVRSALEVFFQWQDGAREFQDLIPFVAILEKKVDLNRSLLKWEQEHITD
jgi:tryptophan 2,3-dioxygenase